MKIVELKPLNDISTDTTGLIQVGNIVGGYGYVHHEQSNRVYSVEGICPTLSTRYDSFQTGFKIIVNGKTRI